MDLTDDRGLCHTSVTVTVRLLTGRLLKHVVASGTACARALELPLFDGDRLFEWATVRVGDRLFEWATVRLGDCSGGRLFEWATVRVGDEPWSCHCSSGRLFEWANV